MGAGPSLVCSGLGMGAEGGTPMDGACEVRVATGSQGARAASRCLSSAENNPLGYALKLIAE